MSITSSFGLNNQGRTNATTNDTTESSVDDQQVKTLTHGRTTEKTTKYVFNVSSVTSTVDSNSHSNTSSTTNFLSTYESNATLTTKTSSLSTSNKELTASTSTTIKTSPIAMTSTNAMSFTESMSSNELTSSTKTTFIEATSSSRMMPTSSKQTSTTPAVNTTLRLPSSRFSTGKWDNITKTDASTTDVSPSAKSSDDCSSMIVLHRVNNQSHIVMPGSLMVKEDPHPLNWRHLDCRRSIVSAISAAVVVFVILSSIICVLKIRRKWRHKLKEERVKTDIWTMSTFNNTIINENFADYTLAPTPMPPLRKDGAKWKKNSQKTLRSSIGSRDLIQSWYSDVSRDSSLRRNTFSEPNNIGKRYKTRARRQASEFSGESRSNEGPYERGRTSTFSSGWNVKARDRSMLMNHQESIDMSTDDVGTFQLDTMIPRNDHIVTEL